MKVPKQYNNNNNNNVNAPLVEDDTITPSFLSSADFFSSDFMSVINELKQANPSLQYLDIISCDTRYNLQFQSLSDFVVTFRFS